MNRPRLFVSRNFDHQHFGKQPVFPFVIPTEAEGSAVLQSKPWAQRMPACDPDPDLVPEHSGADCIKLNKFGPFSRI